MMQKKKGFTLIEILIIIVVIGIMLTMIPLRLEGLRTHAQLSLVVQQREEVRQNTLTHMRQGRIHDLALVGLSNTGVQVVYSSGAQGDSVEEVVFDPAVVVTPSTGVQWQLQSYAIGCTGYAAQFKIALGSMTACYKIDETSCDMRRVTCE